MIKGIFKSGIATFLLVAFCAVLLSSCSRKGGCPGAITDIEQTENVSDKG